MKTLINIFLVTTVLLASCASGQYATSGNYDDAYYVPSDKKASQTTESSHRQTNAPVNHEALNPDRVSNTNALQGEQNASDEQGLTDYERYKKQKEQEMLSGDYTSGQNESYDQSQAGAYDTTFVPQNYQDQSYNDNGQQPAVVNNYYYGDNDGYYDFYYTSRLRRFHSPYYGWDYYDPFYSDNYWYTYNPASWGASIYFGSPWGLSFGWYQPYFYSPFYSSFYYGGFNDFYPYYGYGYPGYYGSYWNGYGHGFYDGYYGGYYGNYYGSNYGYDRYNSSDHGHIPYRSGYSVRSSSSSTTAVRKSGGDSRVGSSVNSTTYDPKNTGSTASRTADRKSTGEAVRTATRTQSGTGAVRTATRTQGNSGAIRTTSRTQPGMDTRKSASDRACQNNRSKSSDL